MGQTERELLKQVGEQAWERGNLVGRIEGMIHNYRYANAGAGENEVPEWVIEDLEDLIND